MAIQTNDLGSDMATYTATRIRRSCRGFSLPEVLAAISILGISVLGVQGILGFTEASGGDAHYAVATELAQAELEDMRLLRYNEVASRSASATVGGLPFAIDSIVTDDAPPLHTKHIATTVSWVSQSGIGRHFRLEATYAQAMP